MNEFFAYVDSGVSVEFTQALDLEIPKQRRQVELAALRAFQDRLERAIESLRAGEDQCWITLQIEAELSPEAEHTGCPCALCKEDIGENEGCSSPAGSVHKRCYDLREPLGWE